MQRWAVVCFVLVAAPLVWRMVALARKPAFTVGLPDQLPPTVNMRGIDLSYPQDDGSILRVRAGTGNPGQEELEQFRLGPSTFLALRDVRATKHEQHLERWTVTGRVGRIRGQTLTIERPRVTGPGTVARIVRAARIDLKSGALRIGE